MKHMLLAGLACAICGLQTGHAKAADLDDDYVTRETIIEERHVVPRERVVVRRYVEPNEDYDDDYYYDGPRIGIVAGPHWGGRWNDHPHGRHGVGWHGHHRW